MYHDYKMAKWKKILKRLKKPFLCTVIEMIGSRGGKEWSALPKIQLG